MLGFDDEYPDHHPNDKFFTFMLKNREKSAVKYSIEKHILRNFVNLSAIFSPRLSVKTHFHS